MNEQDRAAWANISPGLGCETSSWRHIRVRLTYLDVLEKALARVVASDLDALTSETEALVQLFGRKSAKGEK